MRATQIPCISVKCTADQGSEQRVDRYMVCVTFRAEIFEMRQRHLIFALAKRRCSSNQF